MPEPSVVAPPDLVGGGAAVAEPPRPTPLRRIAHVMGTVASFVVHDAIDPAALDAAVASLHEADATFSTYLATSVVARIARGELHLQEAPLEVREVLARCDTIRDETRGAFDADRAGSGGRLDPSGYVKGWAADGAAAILGRAGAVTYAVNVGGDVLVRGRPDGRRGWRVGIRHPDDPAAVCGVVEIVDGAVATSGTYERGQHIVDPRTGRPAQSNLRSVTVIGPALGLADAYATAVFVMGESGLEWLARRPGFGAVGVTSDDRIVWTALADAVRVARPAEGSVPG